jgi:hypothetical protein
MYKYYAGIGSRETPHDILKLMTKLARKLSREGYVLRSGGAKGADTAFHAGVLDVCGDAQIFTAQHANFESMKLAAYFHPNWLACSDYAKRLHARNGMILLGKDLQDPVQFIICWTPNGEVVGGTGQALRIAASYKIPVRNLAIKEHYEAAIDYV